MSATPTPPTSTLHASGTANWKSVLMMLITAAAVLGCGPATQQSAESTPEKTTDYRAADYRKELAMPDFILSTPQGGEDFNSSTLSKEGLILIKYFSPDCGHCQKEAQAYVAKKDSLQNIRTIWVSGSYTTLEMVEEFAEEYGVHELDPLAIGIEQNAALMAYYKIPSVPFSAIYNNDQLVKEYEGDIDFEELIAMNNGTYTPPAPADSTRQAEAVVPTQESEN